MNGRNLISVKESLYFNNHPISYYFPVQETGETTETRSSYSNDIYHNFESTSMEEDESETRRGKRKIGVDEDVQKKLSAAEKHRLLEKGRREHYSSSLNTLKKIARGSQKLQADIIEDATQYIKDILNLIEMMSPTTVGGVALPTNEIHMPNGLHTAAPPELEFPIQLGSGSFYPRQPSPNMPNGFHTAAPPELKFPIQLGSGSFCPRQPSPNMPNGFHTAAPPELEFPIQHGSGSFHPWQPSPNMPNGFHTATPLELEFPIQHGSRSFYPWQPSAIEPPAFCPTCNSSYQEAYWSQNVSEIAHPVTVMNQDNSVGTVAGSQVMPSSPPPSSYNIGDQILPSLFEENVFEIAHLVMMNQDGSSGPMAGSFMPPPPPPLSYIVADEIQPSLFDENAYHTIYPF